MRWLAMGLTWTMVAAFANEAGAADSASSTPAPASEPASAQTAQPATQPAPLQVGQQAPEFSAEFPAGQGGKPGQVLSLKDYRGKKNVLLAFFPKANTPGCTAQMCGYRDDWSSFGSHDTAVISISADKQPAEDKFKTKYQLPMIVLGDPERKIITLYHVPLKLFRTAQRSVVLIDKQGVIQYVNYNYSVTASKDELMRKIAELGK